jgi:hypothetical protein
MRIRIANDGDKDNKGNFVQWIVICCLPLVKISCCTNLCSSGRTSYVFVITMSKYMYSTANLSDKELKDQGNRLFSLKKYEDAVSCYTKAIVRVPIFACLTVYKLYIFCTACIK